MAAVLRRVVAGETGQAIQGEAQQGINRLLEGALIGYKGVAVSPGRCES